jgi:hypothetical protein
VTLGVSHSSYNDPEVTLISSPILLHHGLLVRTHLIFIVFFLTILGNLRTKLQSPLFHPTQSFSAPWEILIPYLLSMWKHFTFHLESRMSPWPIGSIVLGHGLVTSLDGETGTDVYQSRNPKSGIT